MKNLQPAVGMVLIAVVMAAVGFAAGGCWSGFRSARAETPKIDEPPDNYKAVPNDDLTDHSTVTFNINLRGVEGVPHRIAVTFKPEDDLKLNRVEPLQTSHAGHLKFQVSTDSKTSGPHPINVDLVDTHSDPNP